MADENWRFARREDRERGNSPRRGRGFSSRGSAGWSRPNRTNPDIPPPPRGVCKYFWERGSCNRAFDCWFNHEAAPGVETTSLLGLNMRSRVIDDVHGHEDEVKRSPQEVHGYLRKYLSDHFRFESPAQMHAFSGILLSVIDNNSWSNEDGQLFLNTIAAGNGPRRISEILCHEKITTKTVSFGLSFGRGYIPIFQFLRCNTVVRSTLNHRVNALYSVLDNNLQIVVTNLNNCMRKILPENPASEEHCEKISGIDLFGVLIDVFYELLSRSKNVIIQHNFLGPFLTQLRSWFLDWTSRPRAPDGTSSHYQNLSADKMELRQREFVIKRLLGRVATISSILQRETDSMNRSAERQMEAASRAEKALEDERNLSLFGLTYVGPGYLRVEGPRHNNDFVDITEIQVAPTDEELLCEHAPFLPCIIPNAPHPYPPESMSRVTDTQFRLLREDLLASLRKSIQIVRQDLLSSNADETQLSSLIKRKGGRYNYHGRDDSLLFDVYTNVDFGRVEIDSRKGLLVELYLDTPPGSCRNESATTRAEYWTGQSRKRLINGGLVALLWQANDTVHVHLGTISTPNDFIAEAAKANRMRIPIRIQFFEPGVNMKIIEHKKQHPNSRDKRILVESSVMFESVRPFLEALKRVPETIPFSRYLPYSTERRSNLVVNPPAYTQKPGFTFDLSCLLQGDASVSERTSHLNVLDEQAVATAKIELPSASRLDSSQVDALIDTLSREISLIQGPPGTGKTFIGIELIRVLLTSNVGPILLIAFTNHALDHMLASILKAKITKGSNIVRLGGRPSDPTVIPYSIEALERDTPQTRLGSSFGRNYAEIKKIEDEIVHLLRSLIGTSIPSDRLVNHLSLSSPDHYESLSGPPNWVRDLHRFHCNLSKGPWIKVGRGGKKEEDSDLSTYGFWKSAVEYEFLRAMSSSSREELDNSDLSSIALQAELSLVREPLTDRPVEELIKFESSDVWSYSATERKRMHTYWTEEFRNSFYEFGIEKFKCLLEEHERLRREQQSEEEAVRLDILKDRMVIGCTTTGAAKLISLLKGIAPKVLIVEEAGQVLESHVLASLVDSIQHLVLIGDHLQLRPNVNNYVLSMDSHSGKKFYRFDRSLMERLSDLLPMSMLQEQRRMRPSISSLIRQTLYPKLIDHFLVQNYPDVRGMANNVFFLSHKNPESGGGDDTISKHNTFEVAMVKVLVKYLLRQGCYSGEGSIVVLCAYLGQLVKVRDALRGEVMVVLDERDQDALDAHEEGREATKQHMANTVDISQKVQVRSIDNYQGEEADIIILSLVRNSGNSLNELQPARIGFLKSPNRINVAISRARHGLFILGNDQDFRSQGSLWSTVVSILEADGAVGPQIPIQCYHHPDEIRFVSEPDDLLSESPDGGCLRSCNARLDCGHACPYKCRPDDGDHNHIFCTQNCVSLCSRGHPCAKPCGTKPCGACTHPKYNIELPCGHIAKELSCHQLDNLKGVYCTEPLTRPLPACEHIAEMSCGDDVNSFKCRSRCDGVLSCCGRTCAAECHACRVSEHDGRLPPRPEVHHKHHKCEKLMFCGHSCQGNCGIGHECDNSCLKHCRQQCIHSSCKKFCSEPCVPCQEECSWNCEHFTCLMPCGSICIRLPCDKQCAALLECGHQCPSVCGEPCVDQICVICAPSLALESIADLISQRQLRDLDPGRGTLDEMIITLPDCGHVFTVETLDGICDMSNYYSKDADGLWNEPLSPPSGYIQPPACPICRKSITSRRYSRVYKRAGLDILERNIAISLSREIRKARGRFEDADVDTGRFSITIYDNYFDSDSIVLKANADAPETTSASELPTDWSLLDPYSRTHSIPRRSVRMWDTAVEDLKNAYASAMKVAISRSAHTIAWQASFARVYNQEMENLMKIPSIAPRRPEEYAIGMARRKIGQPEPLADQRFRVEAIWLTIEIRIKMAHLAFEGLPTPRYSERRLRSRPEFLALVFSTTEKKWISYISFIYSSCLRDVNMALAISEKNGSHRQALRSSALALHLRFLSFKLDFVVARWEGLSDPDDRSALRERLERERAHFEEVTTRGAPAHRDKAIVDDTEYKKLFSDLSEKTKASWVEIQDSLILGTTYSPPSDIELRFILSAMMQGDRRLKSSGHWYECPNGHPFVVADCGGANDFSRCPECGELIGGRGRLLESNRRNSQLEATVQDLVASGA